MLIKINTNTFISKYHFLSEVKRDSSFLKKALDLDIDLYYECVKVNSNCFDWMDNSEQMVDQCLNINPLVFFKIKNKSLSSKTYLSVLEKALTHSFRDETHKKNYIDVVLSRIKNIEFTDVHDCIKKLQNKIKLESLIKNDQCT